MLQQDTYSVHNARPERKAAGLLASSRLVEQRKDFECSLKK